MISIVTPVYNEEDNVIFFHDAVTRVMEETGMAYELIYVDDGSHDRTNELICGLAEKDPHVRALTFARNFGHQIAITCGMDFARILPPLSPHSSENGKKDMTSSRPCVPPLKTQDP